MQLYYENISEPMDLGYIGSTLAAGGYSSPQRLLVDVQLVKPTASLAHLSPLPRLSPMNHGRCDDHLV